MGDSAGISSGTVYRRLLAYAAPYWPVFALAVLGMGLDALSEVGLAYLVKPMLDDGFVDRKPETIQVLPWFILGIFLVRGLAGFLSGYCLMWIGRRVIKTLRGQLFQHYLYLPAAFYDHSSTGHLLAKLTYNVEQVAEATSQVLTVVVRDTLSVLFLFALMLTISWELTLAMLVLGPLVGLLVAFLSQLFRRYSARIQDNVGDVTRVAEEAVSCHRVVKVFNGQRREEEVFEVVNENNRRLHMKLARAQAASVPVSQLIMAAGMAGILYVATLDTLVLSVGEFGSFLSAVLLMMSPIRRLTNVNVKIQRGIAAGESVFAVLDEPREIDQGSVGLERASGRIEYRDLSFSYGAGERLILDRVDLQIAADETIAIVGRSGSGKSTLVSLLPRFYTPSGGQILLDGRDISEYRLTDLREQFSLVSQDVLLFNDSIAANIAYARPTCSREDIEQAAEHAFLKDFVDELPAGLDTVVGDRGVLLSGGQRQRLAIARALLKDAPILILDEATSALDSESEGHVQRALAGLMRHRTTLVIAHRLSTVEGADRIVVLDQGRIVEQGSHRDLLAREGHYASLYRMQFNEPAEKG